MFEYGALFDEPRGFDGNMRHEIGRGVRGQPYQGLMGRTLFENNVYFYIEFFNHRAKRGGSLFQGSLGGEERSRSDPPGGRSPPLAVAKRAQCCCGLTLRSLVFAEPFALNVNGF